MIEYVTYFRCPNCGSHRTDVDDFKPSFFDDCAIVPFYCHACGTTWNAVYKFEANEEIDVLQREEEA